MLAFLCSIRLVWSNNINQGVKNLYNQDVYLELEKQGILSQAKNGNCLVVFRSSEGYDLATWLKQDQIKIKRIRGEVLVEKPDALRNPGGFDEASFLKQNQVLAKFSLPKSLEEYSVQYEKESLLSKAEFYFDFAAFLNKHCSPRLSGFLLSFGFGQKSYLDNQTRQDFNFLGLNHIIAVSGFHFDLFLLPLTEFLDLKKQKPTRKIVLSLPFILMFLWLTDYPIGLMRASLIYLMDALCIRFNLFLSKKNLLLLLIFLWLLINPFSLFRIGFQLSFLAALVIYSFIPYLNQHEGLKNHPILFGMFLSLLVQVCLLPLLLHHFGNWQLSAIFLHSMLYLPLFSIFVFSYFSIFIYLIQLRLNAGFLSFVLSCMSKPLDFFLLFLHRLSKLSLVKFLVQNRTSILTRLTYLVFAVFLANLCLYSLRIWRGDTTSRSQIHFIPLALIFGSFLIFNHLQKFSWEIYFLDVGQGDSCLVISPDKHSVLIDMGNLGKGYQVIIPAMNYLGLESIDYAVISHFDQDHAGGLLELLDHQLVKSLYFPNIFLDQSVDDYIKETQDDLTRKILMSASKQNIPMHALEKDDVLSFPKQGLTTRVLGPSLTDLKNGNVNQSSLIFSLDIEGLRILFTGDMDNKQEINLINSLYQDELTDFDILKVSHHGSKNSTSKEFLKLIKPSYAFISVGYNNYGHPSPEVLEVLESQSISIKRTDIHGALVLKLINQVWRVATYLDENSDYN